jgi:hypothetical protein
VVEGIRNRRVRLSKVIDGSAWAQLRDIFTALSRSVATGSLGAAAHVTNCTKIVVIKLIFRIVLTI